MQISRNPQPGSAGMGAYIETLGRLYNGTKSTPLKRKLPPYGKGIQSIIQAMPPCDRTIWVYCGDQHTWDLARLRSALKLPVLILPEGDDPRMYSWPVRGCEVVVTDIGGSVDSALLTLADELLQSGATVVRVVHGPGPGLAVFRREVRQ